MTGEYSTNGNLGFVYSRGSYTTIDFPGTTYTIPTGINNAGEVTGIYSDSFAALRGFVESRGTYSIIDLPGSVYTFSQSINDAGMVTGYAEIPNVPESSTWAMMLLALAGLGYAGRRKARPRVSID